MVKRLPLQRDPAKDPHDQTSLGTEFCRCSAIRSDRGAKEDAPPPAANPPSSCSSASACDGESTELRASSMQAMDGEAEAA
mmetsp:Transcript_46990/g.105916  ORF Transcript_46990/g.105916 Transcript_46990/m.105916 type:complete len:81 (+) Transcript_46990:523-765(+)